jgi:Ni/Co efflux regulator RcnB
LHYLSGGGCNNEWENLCVWREPSTALGTSSNVTRIYDIATNTWSKGANMPLRVQQHRLLLRGWKIYVIGAVIFIHRPVGISPDL